MEDLCRQNVSDLRSLGPDYRMFTESEWAARCDAADKVVDQIELDNDPEWVGDVTESQRDYNEDDIMSAWGFSS